MAGTTGSGGLNALALGGIGATVVVVGGAVLVWLGVFDKDTYRLSTSTPQTELVITPSAKPPLIMQGTSQQPDQVETSETAPTVVASADLSGDPEAPAAADSARTTKPDPVVNPEPAQDGAVTSGSDAHASATPASPGTEIQTKEDPTAAADLAALPAPQLDLVRVDPTGDTVIAGRATAGAQVAVLLDGDVLEQIDVSGGGEFVAFATIPPSDRARVISLRAEHGAQQSLSETSFILAPAAPVPSVLALAETAQNTVQDTDAAQGLVQNSRQETASDAETGTETGGALKPEPEIAISATEGNLDVTPLAATDAENPASASSQSAAAQGVAEQETDETGQVSDAAGTAVAQAETAVDGVGAGQTEAAEAAQSQPVIAPAAVADNVAEGSVPSAPITAPATAQLADAETQVIQPEATSGGTTGQAASAEIESAPEPAPAQVAVLRADAQGVTLVQPVAQALQDKVVLDTISYSDSGEVQLAGRARADARVRVYLDNAAVTSFVVAQNGSWGGRLEAVDPGVYRLRLDELDAAGKVLSRLETPFKREAPEVLLPPASSDTSPDAAAPLVRAVTVQEGDTLWAISQERYGNGFLYVRVFEANQDAIRDPDLIYPGQVFTIPE